MILPKTSFHLDNVVSKTQEGLAPQLPNEESTTKYLRQDGTWNIPPGTYSLPIAQSGTRGGVQIGYVTDGANRKYAVLLDGEQMYVEVPWTDTADELIYKSILTSNDAINGFHEANKLKVAIWTNTSNPGVENGIIIDGGYQSATYGFQLAIDDDPTWYMALRQRGTSGWSAWKRIPMGDGTGASGTWGISISGNAATATSATQADSAPILWYSPQITNSDAMNAFNPQGSGVKAAKYSGIVIPGIVSNDGLVMALGWSDKYCFQLAVDDQSNHMAIRSMANGSWYSWQAVVIENGGSYNIIATGSSSRNVKENIKALTEDEARKILDV